MSPELTFVDTNVIVYAHDSKDERKQRIASALLRSLWEDRSGVLSMQVLQEFYVVATRKLRPAIDPPAARMYVTSYGEWRVVSPDPIMIVIASVLEAAHQLSFWDAMIIAAAQRAGATRLVTEDLHHGQKFGPLRIENPFNDN